MFKKFKSIHRLSVLLLIALMIGGCAPQEVVVEGEEKTEENQTMQVHYIDTGNSDCIFIDAQKDVLIDAGDNDDEETIVHYLKELGVEKIDYVISTHPDADHAGGLDAVVQNFEIGTVFISNGSAETKTYRDFVYAVSDKGLKPSVPLARSRFELGENIEMRFFNTEAQGSGNEVSLVTLITYKENKFLFMGDLEAEGEKAILDQLMDVDVLKVGHHGSSSSTTQALLDKVKPEYAIIPCGKDNKYGHPHREVRQILRDNEIITYRTDQQGTIVANADGEKIEFEFERTNESDAVFIGNVNSKIVHRDTCTKLPSQKNQIIFDSFDAAMANGYTPCGNCKPE